MKGSQKQIEWANQIQAKLAAAAQQLLGKNPKADKVINSILAIEHAPFWIDYRNYDWRMILSSMQREGLRNKGLEFSNLIKVNREMVIPETWEEIIQDGKGGHIEIKTKTW